jgi:uncharacterized coiled-coil protein SlyX
MDEQSYIETYTSQEITLEILQNELKNKKLNIEKTEAALNKLLSKQFFIVLNQLKNMLHQLPEPSRLKYHMAAALLVGKDLTQQEIFEATCQTTPYKSISDDIQKAQIEIDQIQNEIQQRKQLKTQILNKYNFLTENRTRRQRLEEEKNKLTEQVNSLPEAAKKVLRYKPY